MNSNGGNILVSTPGRLNDLLQRKDCSLSANVKAMEVLILDEADRLLSMGFETALNQIFAFLPKQRRTGLFSATQVVVDFVTQVNISRSSGGNGFTFHGFYDR